MTESVIKSALPFDFNRRVFLFYIVTILALAVFGLGTMLYKGKYIYLGLILFSPVLLLILTQPKIAISQYIFMLFVSRTVVESIPLTITDISALLVIGAAILDFLLNSSLRSKSPRLALNFLILVAALLISGLFAYEQGLALRAIARVALLFSVFLSLHRLLKKTGVEFPLKFFFWLCVVNSIWVVVTFVTYGGGYRFFGFATRFFDDLTMLTFPLGIAFYLWSEKGRGAKYLFGSLLVFTALVATQSRAPFVVAITVALLVFLVAYYRSQKEKRNVSHIVQVNVGGSSVVGRGFLTVFIFTVVATVAIVSKPELFETVISRFESILSMDISGTILKRLVLWRNALDAFVDNPLVGIGPGNYKVIHTIYPTVQLDFIQFFVRGLNAHNLVLQYLAETGLVGTIPMLFLMINQFRLSRKCWLKAVSLRQLQITLALYAVGITLLLTTVLEADWLWGFAGYTFVFFVSLISINSFQSQKPDEAFPAAQRPG